MEYERDGTLRHTRLPNESADYIAKRFEQMTGRTFKAVPGHVLAAELGSLSHRLDPDQERAVRAICGTAGVVHITGRAGSGKTSALVQFGPMRNGQASNQLVRWRRRTSL